MYDEDVEVEEKEKNKRTGIFETNLIISYNYSHIIITN